MSSKIHVNSADVIDPEEISETELTRLRLTTDLTDEEIKAEVETHNKYIKAEEIIQNKFGFSKWERTGGDPVEFVRIVWDASVQRVIRESDNGWVCITRTLADTYEFESEDLEEVVEHAYSNYVYEYEEPVQTYEFDSRPVELDNSTLMELIHKLSITGAGERSSGIGIIHYYTGFKPQDDSSVAELNYTVEKEDEHTKSDFEYAVSIAMELGFVDRVEVEEWEKTLEYTVTVA